MKPEEAASIYASRSEDNDEQNSKCYAFFNGHWSVETGIGGCHLPEQYDN